MSIFSCCGLFKLLSPDSPGLSVCAGFPSGSVVKNLPAMQETRVQALVGKFPWRRKWQPTPVFLPGKSDEQRSLEAYSPWGHKRTGHDLVTKQQ